MKFNGKYLFFSLAVFTLLALGIGDAFAQAAPSGGDLSAIANRGAQHGDALVNLFRVVAIVIGVALIIGGILALVKDAKSNGNGPVGKGAAFIMIAAGGALTFVTSMIDSTGQTVWGEQGGSRAKIEIEQ